MVFKFTIDNILNKYIPSNQFQKLPSPMGRFLGIHKPSPQPDYLIWLEILIGSFLGILTLEGIFKSSNVFTNHHNAPLIIASYGATAILCFNSSAAPLAQPRNILFGHFFSALIGTSLEKLFSLSQAGRDHYYLGGALSVGLSSVAMSILNIVHPPAGALALLPFIDSEIRLMSWWYLPTHLVSSVVIIGVAMITGNVIRKYPQYWWAPSPPPPPPPPAQPPVSQPPVSLGMTQAALEETISQFIIPDGTELTNEESKILENIRIKINKSLV